MLRIAVPNKGSLSEAAAAMLAEAGYAGRRDSKALHLLDTENDAEFFFLRPRDIATYVASGALDVGITGRDLLREMRQRDASEIEQLGFGHSTFRFAAPPGRFHDIEDLSGVRVASAYPHLVEDFLSSRGVRVELVQLDGAVESAVRLGVADAVADVVATGTTLRQAGLEIFGPVIIESEAVLIRGAREVPGTQTLVQRLRGVMVAHQFVLLDYDLPVDLVEQASRIAPGRESPTVSPLQDPAWVAVRVMVPRQRMNPIMDQLYALGARAILVTAIHAARL